MNTSKIIEALERAVKLDIPMGHHNYFDHGKYCTLGWLAHEAGIDGETLFQATHSNNKWSDQSEEIIYHALSENYELDSTDQLSLIHLNDNTFNTWNDAIELFKGLQEDEQE